MLEVPYLIVDIPSQQLLELGLRVGNVVVCLRRHDRGSSVQQIRRLHGVFDTRVPLEHTNIVALVEVIGVVGGSGGDLDRDLARVDLKMSQHDFEKDGRPQKAGNIDK